MNPPRIELAADGLRVSGDLTFATVTALLGASREFFVADGGVLRVDLSGVTRADSAGLALLIEWLRLARAAGCDLCFQSLPEQMLAIAGAGGLTDILPLSPR